MPNQRPPTPEEAAYLKQNGIDPNGFLVDDNTQQSDDTSNKNGVVSTVAKTLGAHAGSYAGGGLMAMAGPLSKVGAGIGAMIPGAEPLTVPAGAILGSLGDYAVGSYLGQKGQEVIGGDAQKKLEQEQEEAASQNPTVANITDVAGSLLGGGLKPSFRNLELGYG